MSGMTRATTGMSSLGNVRPASTTMMRPSYSSAIMFSPISPSPPRGMTLSRLTRGGLEERQLLLGVGGHHGRGCRAPGFDHVDVATDLLEVDLEGVHQEPVVQCGGRMVQRHVGAIAPLHELPVDAGYAVGAGQQPLDGVTAQQQDDRGTDQLDLAVEVGRTGGDLLG